jgi:hypothetical protein
MARSTVINFFANVFNDPVASVQILFYDLAKTVIGYILNMASAIEKVINKIPGVTIDITSGLDNFYKQIEAASQKVKDESDAQEQRISLLFHNCIQVAIAQAIHGLRRFKRRERLDRTIATPSAPSSTMALSLFFQ